MSVRVHAANCPHRVAIELPIPVECKHGQVVCATCDACSCPERDPAGLEGMIRRIPDATHTGRPWRP